MPPQTREPRPPKRHSKESREAAQQFMRDHQKTMRDRAEHERLIKEEMNSRELPEGLADIFYEQPELYWKFPPEFRPLPLAEAYANVNRTSVPLYTPPISRKERLLQKLPTFYDPENPDLVPGDSEPIALIRKWVNRYPHVTTWAKRTGVQYRTVVRWLSPAGHHAIPWTKNLVQLVDLMLDCNGGSKVSLPDEPDYFTPREIDVLQTALMPHKGLKSSLNALGMRLEEFDPPRPGATGAQNHKIYHEYVSKDAPVLDQVALDKGRDAVEFFMREYKLTIYALAKQTGVSYMPLHKFLKGTGVMPYRSTFRALAGFLATKVHGMDRSTGAYRVWHMHLSAIMRLAVMRRKKFAVRNRQSR